jgi:PAS domain S-box-containing protein
MTEEAVRSADLKPLCGYLAAQPPWSDFPFVVLTGRGGGLERNPSALRLMEALGNVTFLERPFHPTTLVSVVRTALRGRRRQYQARASLEERERAAAELRDREEQLRIALAAGRLGSWSLDLRQRELRTSATCKANFGRDPATEFSYDDLLGAVHADDRERIWRAVADAIATGVEYDIEFRARWPDGSVHWVQVRGQVRYDEEGRPHRMAGVSLDITARKKAEEELHRHREKLEELVAERTRELEAANRRLIAEASERERAEARLRQSQKMEAVGQLTGGIAHDFNNLLTAISGNLELIQARTKEERTARLAANAATAVERGAKLTGQLLAFSRTQRLALRPVDVNAAIDAMQDLLVRSLGPTIDIEAHLDTTIGLAVADANQLELAILNLAINARDAMPEGGTLHIATSEAVDPADDLPPGRYVIVSVTDTGTGMPPEVLDRALEPFYTTKPVGKGTGLGLSQVYGIARQSGGTVRIESAMGEGTTVRVLLPSAGAAAVRDDAAAEHQPLINGRRELVLVVDDDPDVRRLLVNGLEALGYRVAEAAHGRAGVDALERATPDLMIVDYAMPGMTGAEVAAAALRRHPGLPIMFATGYADTAALAGELTSLPVLRKPFQLAELAKAVADALLKKTSYRKADHPSSPEVPGSAV